MTTSAHLNSIINEINKLENIEWKTQKYGFWYNDASADEIRNLQFYLQKLGKDTKIYCWVAGNDIYYTPADLNYVPGSE